MRPRILFLAQLMPYPPVCGGTIRSFNILKRLCSNYDVTLLTFTRRPEDFGHAEHLRGYCSDVRTAPMVRSAARNVRSALKSIAGHSSFIIDRDFVPQMQEQVDQALNENVFDLIYIDHLQMFQYVKDRHATPRLMDEHNVEWRIIQRIANLESGLRKWFAAQEWPKLRDYELAACEACQVVSTVTEEDKRTLQSEDRHIESVNCVPIGVATEEFEPVSLAPDSKAIVSIATMSWPPNIDSMLHFVADIYPLVKARVPDARLVIAGNRPPSSVQQLEKDPSISVPGFVEDIHELASNSAAFIVPLRAGSGMRVKILNAMAMGLPVVSTSVGCEGIDVTHGVNVLLADSNEEFARHVSDLLLDPDRRVSIGAAGRNFVVENYSWEVIYPRLDWLLQTALDQSGSRALL